jgi:amino acid permease
MKPISIVLLIVGVILLSYGVTASDSIGSSFSRFFTGQPTDRTIWLLIAGAVAAILGLTGLLRGSKAS